MAVALVDVRNLRHQRVVGVGVGQQRADREQDLGDRQRGAPLVLEDVEADAALAVDVGVVDLVLFLCCFLVFCFLIDEELGGVGCFCFERKGESSNAMCADVVCLAVLAGENAYACMQVGARARSPPPSSTTNTPWSGTPPSAA